MNRTDLAILRDCLSRARARLSDPSRWCRGALARDAAGSPLISELHPAAASWSVLGALALALYERRADLTLEPSQSPATGSVGVECVVVIARAIGKQGRNHGDACRKIADYADAETRTHAEVIALLTAALAETSPRPRAVQQTGT